MTPDFLEHIIIGGEKIYSAPDGLFITQVHFVDDGTNNVRAHLSDGTSTVVLTPLMADGALRQ